MRNFGEKIEKFGKFQTGNPANRIVLCRRDITHYEEVINRLTTAD